MPKQNAYTQFYHYFLQAYYEDAVLQVDQFSLMPFGKQVVKKESASGCLSAIMNIIWIFTGGLMISLTHLIYAFICGLMALYISLTCKNGFWLNLKWFFIGFLFLAFGVMLATKLPHKEGFTFK